MRTKTFAIIGNFLSPLEKILYDKFQAQQTSYNSNEMDMEKLKYEINYNNKLDTIVVWFIEDYTDQTIIQSSNEKFIEELMSETKLAGAETCVINNR